MKFKTFVLCKQVAAFDGKMLVDRFTANCYDLVDQHLRQLPSQANI